MLQIIEAMRTEISYLKQKVKTQAEEKDVIVESFKTSSGVLLERLKDLEGQGQDARPETGSVLSKLSKAFLSYLDRRGAGGQTNREYPGG